MKILFTGFTSRTVGSERNVYDYFSNVFALEGVLKLAGHTVDTRSVSLIRDPCIDEDYDCALIGVAACQGLSSRFKLGACWALHKFGKRAGIFPSDGRNIYTFPSSVLTCLLGQHYDKVTDRQLDPIAYFLGDLQQEKNNVVDTDIGHHPEFRTVWRSVLERLPHGDKPRCAWPVLIPTHSWGSPLVYRQHFGVPVTIWDPTNVAIPMQFQPDQFGPDGRLLQNDRPRERAWIVSSLQDQSAWIKKQNCKWPVIVVGNKRKAREGQGIDYMPERELIETYYRQYWGHLAFGYPLSDGSWWRMRYIHAALAGAVTCCDPADAMKMPEAYKHSRVMLERFSDEKLANVALQQHQQLKTASWSVDRAVETVNTFVKELVI